MGRLLAAPRTSIHSPLLKEKSMPTHYDLKRSGTQFMFNLKAANGEVVLTSERYTTKQSATNGISAVKQNASVDARYARKTSTTGLPYFTLSAANGENIGTSESYSSTTARDNGIVWVKTNAPNAVTVDNT
jgi:uncharacterized protein YegP (UPF0339 family)